MKHRIRDRVRKNYVICLLLAALLFAQSAMMIHFGSLKTGYHMDEIFTFELSNYSDAFISWSDGFVESWQTSEAFHDALTAGREEAFDYSMPYKNQERDVHPFLYYFVIHTVSSLFPDVFSKWIGIVPNIVFCLLTTLLLYAVVMRISKNRPLSFLATAVWALSIGAMTTAVFIRMYAMLTFFCTLLVLLHLKALEKVRNHKTRPGTWIGLWLCTTLGILTQYYFLVFCFFLCGAFFVYLAFSRRWRELLGFVAAETGAVASAIVLFPAMLQQIFSGYRGVEAFENLRSTDGYLANLKEAFATIGKDVLNGWTKELVLFVLVIWVAYWLNRRLFHFQLTNAPKREAAVLHSKTELGRTSSQSVTCDDIVVIVLGIVAIGYTLVIAKIEPFHADRYYMCIFPLISLVAIYVLRRALSLVVKAEKTLNAALIVLLALGLAASYKMQSVDHLFRYDNKRQILDEYREYPVIIVNGDDYDNSPDMFMPEYKDSPAVFRCQCNGDLLGLKKAAEGYDLSDGFLLYTVYYSAGDESVLEGVSACLDLARCELIVSAGVPVYFCVPGV